MAPRGTVKLSRQHKCRMNLCVEVFLKTFGLGQLLVIIMYTGTTDISPLLPAELSTATLAMIPIL
jgi:hypothetical protein